MTLDSGLLFWATLYAAILVFIQLQYWCLLQAIDSSWAEDELGRDDDSANRTSNKASTRTVVADGFKRC